MQQHVFISWFKIPAKAEDVAQCQSTYLSFFEVLGFIPSAPHRPLTPCSQTHTFQGNKSLQKSMPRKLLHFISLGTTYDSPLQNYSQVEKMLKSVPEFFHSCITRTFKEQRLLCEINSLSGLNSITYEGNLNDQTELICSKFYARLIYRLLQLCLQFFPPVANTFDIPIGTMSVSEK
jgi:hypothetical protein